MPAIGLIDPLASVVGSGLVVEPSPVGLGVVSPLEVVLSSVVASDEVVIFGVVVGSGVVVSSGVVVLSGVVVGSDVVVGAGVVVGLVFLAYALCSAMSYYGPNAKLTNGVGIGIWGHDAIVDVNKTFLVSFGLFVIDVMSFCLNAIINWVYCNVNLFAEVCIVLQKYWYIMALHLANDTVLYFLENDINFALDWSLRFCWVTNNESLKSPCNSTDMLR